MLQLASPCAEAWPIREAGRFRQGLGGKLLTVHHEPDNDRGFSPLIQRRTWLGGIINFYHRTVAYEPPLRFRTVRDRAEYGTVLGSALR